MKINVKQKIKIVLYAIVLLLLVSCGTGNKYDGKILIDEKGDYYQLEYSIGDVYFIKKLNKAKLDSLYRIKNSFPETTKPRE